MPRHPVHERMHDPAEQMRQATAIRFTEKDDFGIPHPSTQLCQRFSLEMMHEQIRHHHPTRRRRRFEQIPPMPDHPRSGKFRSRCEIVCRHRSLRKHPCQPMAKPALSGTDFHDAPARRFGKPLDLPANPPLVAHEKIDPPQIPPASHRLGILRRQMIQQLGNDNAFVQ